MTGVKYTFENIYESLDENQQIPQNELDQFKRLFRLTANLSAELVVEANDFQSKIQSAKTKHKKEFYTKKFNKVKEQWTDEVNRLLQLHHILSENGIDFEEEIPEKCENCGEEYKLGVIHLCNQEDINLLGDDE